MKSVQNININALDPLISPAELEKKYPITPQIKPLIIKSREVIKKIIAHQDKRLLAIIGPCSIHDPKAALEYAEKLKSIQDQFLDQLFIVMRVYFEKPRTTIGWKGLINDPMIDGSCDISKGLHIARELLIAISQLGLPIATEMLDPIVPQYISDLVSWAAIGARTTESQTHREMASGLSMPIGYKNGTTGQVDTAIYAMKSAVNPHSFVGIDLNGQICIVKTRGNAWGHLILRGGNKHPNYDEATIRSAIASLEKEGLNPSIIIDCSHSNSQKKHQNQEKVLENIVQQRSMGNPHIIGFMLESNLFEGQQKIPDSLSDLKYGVSITDACIGFESTIRLLKKICS